MTTPTPEPHTDDASDDSLMAELNAAEQLFIHNLPQPVKDQLERLSYFQRRYLIRVAFSQVVKAAVREGRETLDVFGQAQALLHQAEEDLIEWARQPTAQMEQLRQMYEIWDLEYNRGDIKFRCLFCQALMGLKFQPPE